MRGSSHDRTPTIGADRCLCGHHTRLDVQTGRPCELRGDSSADEGWIAEAEGFSCRVGWLRYRLTGIMVGCSMRGFKKVAVPNTATGPAGRATGSVAQ